MTHSIARTSAIALGMAALVSLSPLSASADTSTAPAATPTPAPASSRALAQRAGTHARLGGIWTWQPDGRSATRRTPLSAP